MSVPHIAQHHTRAQYERLHSTIRSVPHLRHSLVPNRVPHCTACEYHSTKHRYRTSRRAIGHGTHPPPRPPYEGGRRGSGKDATVGTIRYVSTGHRVASA
eukprot:3083138-Rhodomonas_salina.4